MHEMSIAMALLDHAREQCDQRHGNRLTKIGVRVGELAGVDVDSLSFSFEALVKETEFEPVTLEIERSARDELHMTFLEFEE